MPRTVGESWAIARAPAARIPARQPGLNLFDTGTFLNTLHSAPVDAGAAPGCDMSDPAPLKREERLDARARALFLLDFDRSLGKESKMCKGVPGLYTGEHEAAEGAMRRRQGVENEDLAKWFKEKLEEVRPPAWRVAAFRFAWVS